MQHGDGLNLLVYSPSAAISDRHSQQPVAQSGDQEEDARAMTNKNGLLALSTSLGGDTQYVTIGVADENIAIAVTQVQEVLDVQPFVRVPNMPPEVCGMIDVRKRAIPVYDLRLTFGLPSIDVTPKTRIVILDLDLPSGRRQIGVVADRVFEVTALDSTDVEPPPEFGSAWNSQAVLGLGRRNGTLVIILDACRLFGDKDILGAPLGTV
jgi:purine-binding chemotaxis protein CheW